MLVDHNPATWLFMLVGKYFVGWIGLWCFVYFLAALWIFGQPGIQHPASIAIESYGALELLWFLCWGLPFKYHLQRTGLLIEPTTRAQRKALFAQLLATVPDMRMFVRGWFYWAPLDDVYRDDIKDWLTWALWGVLSDDDVDDDEMEEYIQEAEERADHVFRRGRTYLARPIRLNTDKVKMVHRSLLWYALVALMDTTTTLNLLLFGFRHYSQPIWTFLSVFPFRFITLVSLHRSPAREYSYFFRPHKSKKHRPVVFAHGIGVGLPTYVPFLLSLPRDVGVIVMEFLPVSGRITPASPTRAQYVEAMRRILARHAYDDFVYVGHSYGTLMVRPLLDDPEIAPKINSIILVDPVAVLLHLPDVAYNITRRVPRDAPQLEVQWGAAWDPRTQHTLCRRFCWQDHILFRSNLVGGGRRTTAIVASRDCIISPNAVASYVHYGHVDYTSRDIREFRKTVDSWTGEGEIELMYIWDRDHGQSLLVPSEVRKVLRVMDTYCRLDFKPEPRTAEPEKVTGSDRDENKPSPRPNGWADAEVV